MPITYPSEISITKTTDPASASKPTTTGDFLAWQREMPSSFDPDVKDDLFTFESGDVHEAIKQIMEASGLKFEHDVIEFSPDQAATMTAIALAESGGNSGSHNPHGEDSKGLWQINVGQSQTDNHDKFDCAELVQWASGTAVATETITIAHEGFWLI
jgi:Lysozyme like domain